jgi:hypothetical protein
MYFLHQCYKLALGHLTSSYVSELSPFCSSLPATVLCLTDLTPTFYGISLFVCFVLGLYWAAL